MPARGTFFKVGAGPPPFVTPLPAAGYVGTGVILLGSRLDGATSVTFHGTPAAFNVVSASEITTSVPGGAASGTIQVTTPADPLQ